MTRMNTTAQKAFQNEYLGAQEHMSSEAVEYVRGISVVKVFQQTIFFSNVLRQHHRLPGFSYQIHAGLAKADVTLHGTINSFAFLLVPVVILLIGNKSENIAPIITDMFLYVLITR